ncbi:MAG: NAD(P)-dependent oxidoreductase [Albidovulum sp.]
MSDNRFLILGGAGMIGAQLAARIKRAGHPVAVYDNYALSRFSPLTDLETRVLGHRFDRLLDGVKIHRGDICDPIKLRAVIRREKPDCIIHLAGSPIVAEATKNPTVARHAILDGTATLLEVLQKRSPVRRLVFASSSMVYGNFETDPVPEVSATRPINIYGALKLAAETLIMGYCANSDLEPVIVRPSAVYGPGDVHRRVVQTFCQNALMRAPLRISRSADLAIDFTHVDDLVEGLWLAATRPQAAGRIFNISRGRARTLMELAQIVSQNVGDARIVMEDLDINAQIRPKRGSLEIGQARTLLGYKPKIDLEAGIKATIAALRDLNAPAFHNV